MGGKDLENLWVFVNPKSQGLGINIQRTVVPDRGGATIKSLTCDTRGLISGSGGEQKIYSINPRRTSRGYTQKDVSIHLKVDVSLGRCNIEGDKVQCSLKANG